MKKWNITIEAENEELASVLLKLAFEAFTVAAKFNEPLHYIDASLKVYPPTGKINCQEVITNKK